MKAGTTLDGMSVEDVLYNDYKLYNVNEHSFAIGQFFTMNFEEIERDIDKYIELLDKVCEINNYSFAALYVTDIIKKGSYVIYNTSGQNIMDLAYDREMSEGIFIENCANFL